MESPAPALPQETVNAMTRSEPTIDWSKLGSRRSWRKRHRSWKSTERLDRVTSKQAWRRFRLSSTTAIVETETCSSTADRLTRFWIGSSRTIQRRRSAVLTVAVAGSDANVRAGVLVKRLNECHSRLEWFEIIAPMK